MRPKYTFTVFTPTYNRAHTLHRVYDSLNEQSYRDFEWLIVDDGSTDHTRDLVRGWIREAEFPIRYIWQEHRGMHIAFNRAVEQSQGGFFFPLGSDDALVREALERLNQHWEAIPGDQKDRFSGVCCLCRDENGNLIGDRFPRDVFDSNSLEVIYKYRVKGEKGGFHRTEILKEFPLDETNDMGAFKWKRIARKYRVRFVNDMLRIYYQDIPEGSLSRGKRLKTPMTGVYRNGEILNNEIDWFWYWPVQFLRSAVHYVRFSFHCGIGPVEQLRGLQSHRATLLALVAMLFGYLVYRSDLRVR